MKTIFIRDVDEELHAQIKAVAALKHQSMPDFIKDTMQEACHLMTVQPFYADIKEQKNIKKTSD